MRRSGSQNRRVRGQIDDLDVRGLEPSAEERRAAACESLCAVRREQTYCSSIPGCTRELCGIESTPERIRGRCRGIDDGYARPQHAGNERCKHREVRAAEEQRVRSLRIARRIEQVSEDLLKLNEGTVYTSLMRLLQQGWISASWGTSENNRRARFYSITRNGRKQLAAESEKWDRLSGVIARLRTGDK